MDPVMGLDTVAAVTVEEDMAAVVSAGLGVVFPAARRVLVPPAPVGAGRPPQALVARGQAEAACRLVRGRLLRAQVLLVRG
jgi:hypothetical protein